MQHLDEGMIHAWLDGELPPAEREALEAHLAECAQCAAAVAEARGFIAASTRILTALDSVPGGVLPAASTGSGGARPAVRRHFVVSRAWMAAAAVLVLSTLTVIATRPDSDVGRLRVAAVTRDQKELSASAAPATPATTAARADTARPAEEKPQAIAPSASNAPAPMQLRKAAPADAPKSIDENERLKSRLEAERQLTRARSNAGTAGAMADAASPARAPEPQAPAPAIRLSEQPAVPPAPSGFAKDQAEKRADVVSKYDSIGRSASYAQGVSITGRVTSEAGAPLASASVVVAGAGIGTITRDDGSYSLTIPASRANGQTASLVAKLIGYKAAAVPIVPTSAPITQDFVLNANPLALGQVIVTGAGTATANDKLGAVTELDSATSGSAVPRLLSRNTIHAGNDTVVTTIYSIRGVSVSLVDHSAPRVEALQMQVRGAVSEMPAKSRTAAAAVNSISWSDSTGHTRTLRGPLTPTQLEQLKQTLFATP
ncbi:MAG TPA: zf-HC2 domain-containing protein [Gemmatimonadaceae bacterium]|nr:zf-HC2 domain-containing protein [Gemmatimonadaceae bacterium]